MKYTLIPLMIFSLLSNILTAAPLEIGSTAPELSAIDHEGQTIDLGAALSEGITVVFFYPKAMTPGCTKQACSLRDAWEALQQREVTIFGVSSDKAEAQAEFRNKHQLPFTLIADTDQAVSKAFGKSRWSRQAYIFKDGILVWLDLKASTVDQADDVLAALDALKK
jgi:peroxiredoxin Q/BCP